MLWFLVTTDMISLAVCWLSVCVCGCLFVCVPLCVCVCMCVCVCVCLYSFTIKTFSVCNDFRDILESTDQWSCVVNYYSRCFCQVLLSPFPKISYFTFKDETLVAGKLERKRYDMLHQQKDDVGYKSASSQKRQVTKRY